ncbi:MAG: hypothetical protein M5U01_43525 [Ardenticatenaceae bacterium]|nr:hypothetical protein [Ardenticatenaceae bacterium]HBY99010.1 hypothetical protein [Chloroflexota bacterium]
MPPEWESLRLRLEKLRQTAAEFLYGMTFYEVERMMRRERTEREHLMAMILFGDMLGLPVLPPYYTLRLLPYIIPDINRWRRALLREKDLTDLAGGG